MAKQNKRNQQTNTVTKEKLSAKKAAVLQNNAKSRQPLILILICLVIVGGGIYWFLSGRSTPNSPVAGRFASNQMVDKITYPVSLFADGHARHFNYQDGDITVKFFILQSSDGIIRAAFDACDVCWPAGRGYYQDGDHMVCRNCNRRFASVLVNEVKGGCNPAPLTRSISGDQVVIKIADILDGKPYFNFKGKV